MAAPRTVLGALRQFLPSFLSQVPGLSQDQRRAVGALTHCRTPALGGNAFACAPCGELQFAWHSCNHKACPQCGGAATAHWVQRELGKLVHAPYFLVTFTLPSELRSCFFGPHAKEAYDLFFTAAAGALSAKLRSAKGFKALTHGFTAILHTWNQRLLFHPHLHFLVPGAGLDAQGKLVRVRDPQFLVHLPHLQAAFRQQLRTLLDRHGWQADPEAWRKDWGVHIQPVGSGAPALLYLGRYVARTAIHDSRILQVTKQNVSFRWKNRDAGRTEVCTLQGEDFVKRYLTHVLPRGLRSIRYYGFCHPTAKADRLRVQLLAGGPVQLGPSKVFQAQPRLCPCCQRVMIPVARIPSPRNRSPRGPPASVILAPFKTIPA